MKQPKKPEPKSSTSDVEELSAELKTSAELAEILNLTTRRIRQLSEKGVVHRDEDSGKYYFCKSVHGYCKYLQENNSKEASSQAYQEARANKEKELALALKRKREILEGRYISREDYGMGVSAAMHVQSREFTILLNKFQRLVPGISDSLLKAIETAMVKSHNAVCNLKLKSDV